MQIRVTFDFAYLTSIQKTQELSPIDYGVLDKYAERWFTEAYDTDTSEKQ